LVESIQLSTVVGIPDYNFTHRVSRDKVVVLVKFEGPNHAFFLRLGVFVADFVSLENAVASFKVPFTHSTIGVTSPNKFIIGCHFEAEAPHTENLG
jgi:hypothetical protein